MSWPNVGRVGSQTPRIRKVPAYATTTGLEAIELYQSTGADLDPWQRLYMKDSLAERLDNPSKWAAFETALIVARQNGKGACIECKELAGLYVYGRPRTKLQSPHLILHSAHEFKTAREGFLRVKALIDNTDDLRKKVKRIMEAHGEEGIELITGQRLLFVARKRTGGSGRGFSGDDVIMDEAFNLSAAAISAMLPALSARPNPQIGYYSSAPLREESEQLRKIQARGRAEGPARRLTYLEWSAERTVSMDDRDAWYQANPGLGIRLSEEFVETELDAMDEIDFARERLSIEEDMSGETVLDMALWAELADISAQIPQRMGCSIDVTPERKFASIGAAGPVGDTLMVEVWDHRAGTGWVVDRAKQLDKKYKPVCWVVDEASPAASLIPDLEDAGLKVDRANQRLMAKSYGAFYDRAQPDQCSIRHRDDPRLNVALDMAVTRDIGDGGKAWSRKGVGADISPLVSVTLALGGYLEFKNRRRGSKPMMAYA